MAERDISAGSIVVRAYRTVSRRLYRAGSTMNLSGRLGITINSSRTAGWIGQLRPGPTQSTLAAAFRTGIQSSRVVNWTRHSRMVRWLTTEPPERTITIDVSDSLVLRTLFLGFSHAHRLLAKPSINSRFVVVVNRIRDTPERALGIALMTLLAFDMLLLLLTDTVMTVPLIGRLLLFALSVAVILRK